MSSSVFIILFLGLQTCANVLRPRTSLLVVNVAENVVTDDTSGSSTTASQPQQGGGLFGSMTATTQPSSNLFASSTNATQPQQSGGLFGSAAASGPTGGLFSGQQSGTGGGLFGSTATSQTQQAGQTGGLFGGTASQPSQTGGLFGQSQQPQQQQQQQQPQQTSGLFGSIGQTQPQQAGGLFGSLGQTQSQQPSGGLFGSTITQSQPQQGGGLFSLVAPKAAPNASLFGGSLSQPSLPPLGLGQSTQAQQTVPGVRIDLSNVKGVTRFSDLHDDVQKEIILIDEFIHKQISFKEQIDAIIPSTAEQVNLIAPDVQYLTGKADTVEMALDNDVQAIKHLRELVRQDVDDAKLSFKSIENLKLPPQFHYQSSWQPTAAASGADGDESGPVDLVSYFSSKAESLEAQLKRYKEQVAEIEAHLRTVESSATAETEALLIRSRGAQDGWNSVQDKIRELARTMKLFEDAIMNVASRVGGAREQVVDLTIGGTGQNGGAAAGGDLPDNQRYKSAAVSAAATDRRSLWS